MEPTIKKGSSDLKDSNAEKPKEKSILSNRKLERDFSQKELAKKPVTTKPSEDKLV